MVRRRLYKVRNKYLCLRVRSKYLNAVNWVELVNMCFTCNSEIPANNYPPAMYTFTRCCEGRTLTFHFNVVGIVCAHLQSTHVGDV